MSEERKHDSDGQEAKGESDYRQVIGTGLFELVWWGMDVRFWWSESHVAFLWWGVVGAAVAIYRHVPSFQISFRAIGLLILCAIIAQSYLPPMPGLETETHGWLIPANDPTPPNVCDTYKQLIPGDSVLVLFGGSTTVLPHRLENRDKQLPPLAFVRIADCSVLSMEKSPKGIMVDADIFAEDGFLAARIRNNEFHLVSNEISYSERSEGDPSRIAVYDRKGNELLWVRYINPRAIEVRGTFRCRKMPPVIATKDKMMRGENSMSRICANDYESPNLRVVFSFQ